MRIKKFIMSFAVLMCLLLLPTSVYAKDGSVTISSVAASTSQVTVMGSTEALAVMIQIRDTDGNIVVMRSFGTVSGEFTAVLDKLSLTSNKEYKVYAADYEGGDWCTKVFTVAATGGGTGGGSATTVKKETKINDSGKKVEVTTTTETDKDGKGCS